MAKHFDVNGGAPFKAPRVVSKGEAAYTAVASLVRLGAVREVLVKRGLDALVFIGGVDSQDNLGCLQGINYLLLGASGAELATPLLLDETYEDTIVVLTKGGVRVYTTPVAGEKVARVAACWPGCELFSLDKRSFRDQDAFEDHKMLMFKQMLAGLPKVGVSVQARDVKKEVEKWPLIQSYALDEAGQRSFFTQAHDVASVFDDLAEVYDAVGAHDVAAIALQQGKLLAQHFNGLVQTLEMKGAAGKNAPVVRKDFLALGPENLTTYYTYGAMRRQAALTRWGLKAPTMLIGAATAARDAAAAAGAAAGEGHPRGDDILHATVEARDPQAPLVAARTLFLRPAAHPDIAGFGTRSEYTRGIVPPPSAVAEQQQADLALLEQLYVVLVRAADALKEHIGSSFHAARDADADAATARRLFAAAAAACGVDVAHYAEELDVSVTLMNFAPHIREPPANGRAEATARDLGHCTVYIRLHLGGVTRKCDGAVIGGLLYGDTIAAADGEYIGLTQEIPAITATLLHKNDVLAQGNAARVMDKVQEIWACTPDDAAAARLNEGCPLKSYLATARHSDGGHLYLPMVGCGGGALLSGKHALFANGVVLNDRLAGSLSPLVFSEHAARVLVHNPLELDLPAVVAVEFTDAWAPWSCLAAAQRAAHRAHPDASPERALVLVFQPGTQAKRDFVMKVLPVWKRLGMYAAVSEIPLPLQQHLQYAKYTARRQPRVARNGLQMYSNVRDYKPFATPEAEVEESAVELVRKAHATSEAALAELHPAWQNFTLRRSEMSSVATDSAIDSTGAMLVPPLAAEAPDARVVVDVVVGSVGVGRHKFANHLRNVLQSMAAAQRKSGEDPMSVHVLSTRSDGADASYEFDPMKLYKQVRGVAAQPGRHRIIYIPPGYTPTALVLHHFAILAKVAEGSVSVALNAVTALINEHIYLNSLSAPHDFHFLPGLCDLLTNGYLSQALILAGNGTVLSVNQIERFLRAVNPTCALVYTQDDAVQGILSPSDLGASDKVVARKLSLTHSLHHDTRLNKLRVIGVKFQRLITTRYRVTEFASKLADPLSDVGKGVLRMKAVVHVEGKELEITVLKGKPFATKIATVKEQKTLSHVQDFVFTGLDVDETKLRGELEFHLLTKDSIIDRPGADGAIVGHDRSMRPLITKESLQEADVEDISSAMHHRSLPVGWYFDGVSYVNAREEKYSKTRPDIDELTQEYIDSYNQEAEKHNAAVAAGKTATYTPHADKDKTFTEYV
eukprot:TRINITY_DN3375_c0_g1_i1.p1 TRINITY_DN3375_c0_g1~~TRINITY_DN3375_c0_g1_i1.p1  ORF type:complete len:1250 (+),score=554.11 TRINITY_DN3375_c0_g1_i1:88-3837(+)